MSKVFRIGVDCRLWNETGVGRYVRNLVWELAKIDKKNEYILFFKENEYRNVELPGTNFRKVKANVHWHTFAEQILMPKFFIKEKLDLVHIPYFNVPVFYPGRFITTSHDVTILHLNTGKASTLPKIFYLVRRVGYFIDLFVGFNRAKRIISVSQATKKEIIDNFHIDPEKISVIYEGVDRKIQGSELRTQRVIHNPYFLYVGNAYPHKNLERLIEAFLLFKKDRDDVKLVLVGKEDFFYKRLKQHVKKLQLDDKVLFYEKVSDSGLSGLYKHAIALIIPSLMEGFGLPALEAMANNCLVIASDIPVFHEICANVAVYFDPLNPKDIAKNMQEVCDSNVDKWNKLKQEGKTRAKKFSWRVMAEQTLQVYESSARL